MNKKTFQKVLIACVGFLIFVTFMAVIFHHFADTKDEPVSAKPNKVVYLTFDDGPSKNTKAVLRILKHYDVHATFFVTGQLKMNLNKAMRLVYIPIVMIMRLFTQVVKHILRILIKPMK